MADMAVLHTSPPRFFHPILGHHHMEPIRAAKPRWTRRKKSMGRSQSAPSLLNHSDVQEAARLRTTFPAFGRTQSSRRGKQPHNKRLSNPRSSETPHLKLPPSPNRRANTAPALAGQPRPPVSAGGPVVDEFPPPPRPEAAWAAAGGGAGGTRQMGGGGGHSGGDGEIAFHSRSSTRPTKVTINGFRNTRISSAMARAPRFPTDRAATPATIGMARTRNIGTQGRNDTKRALIERAREKARYGCATLPGIELMGRQPKLFVTGEDSKKEPKPSREGQGSATTAERYSLFGMDPGALYHSIGDKRAKMLAKASLQAVGLVLNECESEEGAEPDTLEKAVVLPKLFQIVMQNSLLHRAKQTFIKSSKLHQERTTAEHEFTEMHEMIRRLQNDGYGSDESEGNSTNDDDYDNDGTLHKKGKSKKKRKPMPKRRGRKNSMEGGSLSRHAPQEEETSALSSKTAQEEWDMVRGQSISKLEYGVSDAVKTMLYEERFKQLGDDKLSRYQDIWTRRCELDLDDEVPLTSFCIALSRVNKELVSPSQIEYCLLCLDFLQEMNTKAGGAGDAFVGSPHVAAVDAFHTFDEFVLVAALSDRLKVFAEYTAPFFENLDFTDAQGLHARLQKARDLFYLSESAQLEGLMSFEEFEVLCFAGQINPGTTSGVLRRMLEDNKPGVDFLDFLSNLPLFVHIHESIIGASVLDHVRVTHGIGRQQHADQEEF